MRSWLLMFQLLLLSILIHEAQGIRLRKASLQERQHNVHESKPRKGNNDGVEENTLCKIKHCSVLLQNEENKAQHKLDGYSTTEEIEKEEQNDLPVNSSSLNEQRQATEPDTHPYILDHIAGMDYSLEKRKPPVHN
ncbi:hypothetical protein BUALT_Bualt12G0088700 [Buddleja alternifolia]|uniref:Uncharacterized protein n=1 Tax=Buddleja alternifolia TaxID=168488 RepID=A0AAV6WUK8_9LAMI|nr:hypothetical protein BUALT_Bualt12G0088700 [Buddleja alternifolia]